MSIKTGPSNDDPEKYHSYVAELFDYFWLGSHHLRLANHEISGDAGKFYCAKAAFKFVQRGIHKVREQANLKPTQAR